MKTQTYELTVKSKTGFLAYIKKHKYLCMMILPVLLYYLVFAYVPMFGIVLAFKKYDYALGILKSPFVGWDNFKFFFTSGQAALVTRNTFLYNLAFIFAGNVAQLIVAIFLTEIRNKRYRKLTQTCIFFPYFISWVVIGAMLYNVVSYDYGILNSILRKLSMEPINVYTEAKYWPFILTVLNIWKGVGYGSVIYMASITGMDTSIYEAAEIDGATTVKRIWYITLPSLRPTMVTVILLAFGHVFKGNFQMFFNTVGSNGLLYNTTDVIDTFVFRSLLQSNDIGMSTAVGLYQSVLCFVFVMLVNAIVKKIDSDSALF